MCFGICRKIPFFSPSKEALDDSERQIFEDLGTIRDVGSARKSSRHNAVIIRIPERNLTLVLLVPDIMKVVSGYRLFKC